MQKRVNERKKKTKKMSRGSTVLVRNRKGKTNTIKTKNRKERKQSYGQENDSYRKSCSRE